MNKSQLIALSSVAGFGVGFLMMILMSMTYSEAGTKTSNFVNHRIVYTVPLKPKSTIVIYTDKRLNELLSKGYQIQEADGYRRVFVMVKY